MLSLRSWVDQPMVDWPLPVENVPSAEADSASPRATVAKSLSTRDRTNSVMYFDRVMFLMAATTFALRTRSASTLTFMHRSLDIAPPGKGQGVGHDPAGLLDRPRRKASLGNVNVNST